MKVAVIGPTYPLKGGIAQHTTSVAFHLRSAGHDVRLVSWLRQYPKRLYPGEQTVDEREFRPFERTERVLSWDRPDTWWRAGRALRDTDVVIFAHTTPIQAPSYRTMMSALRASRTATVVICHNVLPHEPRMADKLLVRSLLGAATRVVVHSPTEGDLAKDLTGRPATVVTMPPHWPEAFVRSRPAPGEHRRLLFFGLVRPYKGVDLLLHALAQGPSDVHLRIAGEFWGGVDQTQELAHQLGIAERVELISGYVPARRVSDLFHDVDALVLPYRSATSSQAVWSGFQFGVPVIATRAGHLADDIRDGVDGLVVEPQRENELAEALRRFYEPGVPERMRAAVVPVDPGPYWERYVEELLGPSMD